MKAKAYYLLRRFLSQSMRNKLKNTKYSIKKKLSPVRKKVYGSFNAEDLKKELETVVNDDFEVLVVHSSYSNLLPMYEGSLSDLLEVVLSLAKGKTLVMPAFYFGNRKYNYDVVQYFRERPNFDVDKMPSQMGLITEMFRKLPGVMHSCHPTHRISALGPRAEFLVSGHHLSKTGCGKGSPFDKMSNLNTKVLGLGTYYYQCMTQTHSAEDVLIENGTYPTKFHLDTVPITLIKKDNWQYNYQLTWPDKTPFRRVLHPFLRRILDKQDLYEWKYCGVPFFLANAPKVQEVLITAALKGKSVYK